MKHPAPVARAIILGNIGVAFADVLLTINQPGMDSWFRHLLALSPANLLEGAWWEPFSYMWLHAPPVGFWVTHILFNMLTLSIFGGPVESKLGSVRFAGLYLIGGLAAAAFFFLQAWWEAGLSVQVLHGNSQEIVGASGAVLAVVAAFAVYYPDARLFLFPIPFPIRARKAVLFFIVLSVAFLFVPALSFIGHSAHIGGLVAGYLLARAWRREMPEPPVLAKPVWKGMEEMAVTLAVAELGEPQFRRELRSLLDELGHGRWRPLTVRERALLRRAHLLV
ncbi:MAG: rhomboid family intramembrane serine protease [Verrucomicrobia bacterium]|nr:rhomboid family intramembrane serine protease [Verrucomicrobiota bacterium]